MPKILEAKPILFLDSLHATSLELPTKCLLNSKILGWICPECDCAKNPQLLKPYLDRELIIPILASSLAKYKTSFGEMILNYPYIGSGTAEFLKNDKIMSSPDGSNALCPHCFDKKCKEILKKIDLMKCDPEIAKSLRHYLKDFIFPNLSYCSSSDEKVLEEIGKTVIQNNLDSLALLESQLHIMNNLRYAGTFNASLQISRDDLININSLSSKSEFNISNIFTDFDEKKWAIEALHVDYNPNMPLEEYLDVIKGQQKKITTLLNKWIYNKQGSTNLTDISNKITKINREIASSKSMELFTCSTSFLQNNTGVILSMVLGGLMGYSSASFLGCTVGSVTGLIGSVGTKILSKDKAFNITKYPKNTTEWLKSKVETSEEKFISTLLSKDIETIQVWNLRKKLKTA